MYSQDVGRLILSTQGEVKRFKDQLQVFADNNIEEGFNFLLIVFFYSKSNIFKMK